MANGKQQNKAPEKKTESKAGKPHVQATKPLAPLKPENPIWLNPAIILGVLLVTYWCYSFTLGNDFTNWDDGVYISEDPWVKNLSLNNLKVLLFGNPTENYYHPITMLSLALNYHFSGMNPQSYYITEIIMHLLNTVMVFILTTMLLRAMVKRGFGKIKGIPYIAGACALLQGVHPMHVESVSWLAERKDVLYLFFYLAGMMFYVKYANGERIPWMKYVNIIPIALFLWAAVSLKKFTVQWDIFSSSFNVNLEVLLIVLALTFAAISLYSFLNKSAKEGLFFAGEMFLFSVTSKPLAVVFPLSLIAIDILLKRDKLFIKPDWGKFKNFIYSFFRLFLEKWPLFLMSLFFGYVAYLWQKTGGSITSFAVFTKTQRVTFVGVNYLMYLIKLFVPTNLCSFYPYPEVNDQGYMPMFFYIAPFIMVGGTLFILWLASKGGENLFRIVAFGFAYYFFNVMFVLQFISSGPSIMADRYSYASYFGFVFMLIYLLYMLQNKLPSMRYPVYAVVGIFSLVMAYMCEARTHIWHNTKTLWQDVIAKFPATIDTSYGPAGKGHTTSYTLKVHNGVETAYKNLGNYYAERNEYDTAYMNFEVLERIRSTDAGVYSNIGNIWAIKGDFKKSLAAYSKSLKMDSTGSSAFDVYLDRGITYSRMSKFDSALRDFNHADKMQPNCQKLYENRGFVYLNGVKQYDSAIADYNRLLAIDPTKADYYLNRGIAEFNKNEYKTAIEDFNKDISIDPKSMYGLFNLSVSYKNLKDYKQAIFYAQKAQAAGYKMPAGYIEGLQNPK